MVRFPPIMRIESLTPRGVVFRRLMRIRIFATAEHFEGGWTSHGDPSAVRTAPPALDCRDKDLRGSTNVTRGREILMTVQIGRKPLARKGLGWGAGMRLGLRL